MKAAHILGKKGLRHPVTDEEVARVDQMTEEEKIALFNQNREEDEADEENSLADERREENQIREYDEAGEEISPAEESTEEETETTDITTAVVEKDISRGD